MSKVQTNKRILVFADESFVQGTDHFSIGVIVVAAEDLPGIENKVLARLGNNVGEIHAARQSEVFTRTILDELASGAIGLKSIRTIIRRSYGDERSKAYVTALHDIVVASLKLYKTNVLKRSIINNADLYMDEVSQTEAEDVMAKLDVLRKAPSSQFRAIRKLVVIDSVVSRSLQFADAVAFCIQPRLAAKSDDFDRWGIFKI